MSVAEVAIYARTLAKTEQWRVGQYIKRKYPAVSGLGATPFLLADGDSITFGVGATTPSTDSWPALVGTMGGFRVAKAAVGGSVIADVDGRFVSDDAAVWPNAAYVIYSAFFGTNDLYYGATGVATWAAFLALCLRAKAAGYKVVPWTILPRSNAGTPVGFETERQTFNTLLRANYTSFSRYLVDVAADTVRGQAGQETNSTYYADLCHPTTAGYARLAQIARIAFLQINATS
jgi:lysophospholipase L1-like esterase